MQPAGHRVMRYALISDIHSNLPALEAVLKHISQHRDLTATYHLGDLVGYAPWPNETVALLRESGIPGAAGNYDSTVGTDYKPARLAGHERVPGGTPFPDRSPPAGRPYLGTASRPGPRDTDAEHSVLDRRPSG
jgi:calcineurin-like phosphoesterase family protein